MTAGGTTKGPRKSESLLFDASAYYHDMLTILTHLSALATGFVGREQLFRAGASLGYRPSPYFAMVLSLVRGLGYDFADACRRVAQIVPEDYTRAFFLRFGNTLESGESEGTFLERETRVLMEDYTNRYERDIEALRKWTDAFVALEAASTMVVLVAFVSNMIYPLDNVALLGVEIGVLAVSVIGAWLIRRFSPFDPMVHALRQRSPEQARMRLLAWTLGPGSLIAAAITFLATRNLGLAMIASAVLLMPLGLFTSRLEAKVDSRDRDLADFIRSLGGITAARGSTVIDSLNHVDPRTIGKLEPELRRFLVRLHAGVDSLRATTRFMVETGSELVVRVMGAFADAARMGGDPGRAGGLAADLGLRLYLLRSKRRLVSSSFNVLIMPLHGLLAALLLFVGEVVAAFNSSLAAAQSVIGQENPSSLSPEALGLPSAMIIPEMDVAFVSSMVITVAIALTVINTFVAQAASGGHNYKLALYGAMNMGATGVAIAFVPLVARGLFGSLTVT